MQSTELLISPGETITERSIERSRDNLNFFSQWAFREKYDNAWFHRQWFNAAQNPEVRRAINIAPRNSGKTTCWSKKTPLWLLGRDNNIKILLLSRTSSRAMANLRFIRQNIEDNARVKMVFPTLEPSMPWSDDELAVKNTRNDGESSVLARGLGGSITGFRADILAVDDLIDKTNVGTDLQRAKVSEYWDEQVLPTLNPDGRVFIVGTRYSNKDWYARMMESEGYKDNLFIFPAFKVDENKELVLDENGQPISYWPQRWSTQRLLERKQEVTSTEGSIAFSAQYMCDPSGYEGMLFRSDWLQFYTGDELMQHYGDLEYLMGVDPNISAEAKSDNTAIVTIAVDRKHNDVYLLDIFAQPLDFIDQVKKLRELATKTQLNIGKYFLSGEQRIRKVGIESIAYQKALSATGYTMGLPVQEVIHGRTDKVTRLLRIQPHIENGRIKFPDPEVHRDLKWWAPFLDEYLSFPRGRRDDMCDALEIAISVADLAGGGSSIPYGPSGDNYGRNLFEPDNLGRGLQSIKRPRI